MKDKPRVSIITASFASERTIRRTIESVLHQTYDNIEYIIIDGGSTDGTLDIIEEYKDRIDYYISEKDNGIYDAFNKGIKVSSGEIIGIINSDDWYMCDAVEMAVEALISGGSEIICGNIIVVEDEQIKRIERSNPGTGQWCGSRIKHPSVFAYKRLYDEIGLFDDKLRIASDYKWLLEVMLNNRKMIYVDREFAFFRRGGISSGKKNSFQVDYESYGVVMDLLRSYSIKVDDYYSIKEYWRDKLGRSRGDAELKDNPQSVVTFLKKNVDDTVVAIWGTGHYGRILIDICINYGMKIPYVVDSNKHLSNTSISGVTIKHPSEIANDDTVVLMAIDLRKEVLMRIASDYDISAKRILTLEDYRRDICSDILGEWE